MNINFIKNGGWHFTNLKRPEDLHHKMSNFAHHLEYEESGIGVKELKEKRLKYIFWSGMNLLDRFTERDKNLLLLINNELPFLAIKPS